MEQRARGDPTYRWPVGTRKVQRVDSRGAAAEIMTADTLSLAALTHIGFQACESMNSWGLKAPGGCSSFQQPPDTNT